MNSFTGGLRKLLQDTKKGKRAANSLLEMGLYMLLAFLAIGVLMALYSTVQNSQKTTATVSALSQVRAAVEAIYQGQASFTGIAPSALAASLPASMYNSTAKTISNPFTGIIAVNADTISTASDSYDLIVTNLPKNACVALSSIDYGRSLYAVKIDATNGTAAVAGSVTAVPLPPASAAAACTGMVNSVGLQFH